MSVVVRYAPSPTGNPHVGNIRTALFTYLFAKANKGKFLLRIEDTDKTREVGASYQAILDSLKWLGISFDDKPILQSARLGIYQKHAQKLVDKNLAYKKEGAIYFKTDKIGETFWLDLVGNKKISFRDSTQEDFVILKSDQYPTYHLASVVDDHLMEITHVTRGEDWISSTPKHIMLYKAFDWKLPEFAHFPNILATDRVKLSKRHGAIGVLDYQKDGFLPEALLNFLALLGWSPPSGKEILILDEMIKEFDLKDINLSPAVFDLRKLEWMNGEYIRKMSDGELIVLLQDYLVDHPAREKLKQLVPLIKSRIKKLSDFIPLTDFLFNEPEYEKEIFQKVIKGQKIAPLLKDVLQSMEKLKKPWTAKEFENTFRQFAKDHHLSAVETFQLIRVAVSGQLVTPPLFESIKILGEEEMLKRVELSVNILQTL